ncbi:hypothetical protein PR202_gb25251 [Eleusine coracana subsp. coracana]|uniref:Disease resistance N-terminal domain-containing protein n=1 Tax=Eleusine coracana subsp. coracana TaxID=191504 RepID=A0AAV5FNR8_ELECO|nr:hypothetical protein PR202_gb25251 [Eleusine coracana subsp. coracana]
MELTMGAMAPLFPKLFQMLENKYVEQRGLKREVETLSMEMEMVHAALLEVSRVPPDQLSEPDKIWAQYIRELSYDMEDAIDAFIVRVVRHKATPADTNVLKKISHKTTGLIKTIQDAITSLSRLETSRISPRSSLCCALGTHSMNMLLLSTLAWIPV